MKIEKQIKIKCSENELINVITEQFSQGNELTYCNVFLKDIIANGKDYKKIYEYLLIFEEKEKEDE
jgi:hypothetical protein